MLRLNRLLLMLLPIAFFSACASMEAVDNAMAEAQEAYSRFSAENPPQSATMQYRMYYARAEAAKQNGNRSTAIEMAELARKEAEASLEKRGRLAQDVKKKLGWFQYELERVLHPSQEVVEAYFSALDAYKEKSYEVALTQYQDGMKKLELEKAVSFQDTIVLKVPPEMAKTYKGMVRVYSYIGEDRQLHDIKGEVAEGIKVIFLEKRYMKRDFQFYHIQTLDGSINGWIYPHFVAR